MTSTTDRFVWLHETGFSGLFGIHHDLRWPEVAARAVTGLTLDPGKGSRAGCVATQAFGRMLFRTETLRRSSVGGGRPGPVDRAMAEFAPLGSDEVRPARRFVSYYRQQQKVGENQSENTHSYDPPHSMSPG